MRRVLAKLCAATAMVGNAACSGDDGAPPFQCRLGELTGAWKVQYAETNGSCGPVNDETVVLSPGANPAADGCTYRSQQVSADKCSITTDFTCPLKGIPGDQQWAGVLRHVAANRLEGPLTLQVTSPQGICRSTYQVTWTAL